MTRAGEHSWPERPASWLLFVELDPFEKSWRKLDLGDVELRELQLEVLRAPTRGVVVVGTGGVRKLRFAPSTWGRGKSGAIRVYYALFPAHGVVLLIFAHDKTWADAIPASEKASVRALITRAEEFLNRRR
jgi:hypothetical protein